MSKNIIYTIVAASAIVGGICMHSQVVNAAGDCTIVAGVVNITGTGDAGNDLCNIDSSVSTINYNGTIAEFGTILNAYNLAGWGSTDGLTDINAVITDEFGSEQLTWLGSLTANITDTATISITPTVKDITYISLPYTMPNGIVLDFEDVIVHIPDTSSVMDAVDLFRTIGNGTVIVAAEHEYTISEDFGLPTIHMPEGTPLANLVALAETVGADMIVAENGANNPVIVNDASDDMVINLPAGTTLSEALTLLASLDVDATVAIAGSNEFTITLAIGQEPVVNMAQTGDDSDIKAPTSGVFTFESQGVAVTLLPAILMALLVAFVFARKRTTTDTSEE